MSANDDPDRGLLSPWAGGNRLSRLAPAPDLSEYVDFHWMVEWDLPERHVQGVLPFPCFNLVAAPDGVFVHGPVTRRYDRELEGRGRGIGTRLRAGTYPGFTGRPAWPLVDRQLPPHDVFGPAGGALACTLARDLDPDEHVEAVEAFLRARRPDRDPRAEIAMRIVDEMLAEPASARVGDIAARFGLSPRALQRLFRHYVGVSPKTVLQRSRMHEAVVRVSRGEEEGAALALELGYSDQAHFINDFRATVGRSPSRYARSSTANGQGSSSSPSTPDGPVPRRRWTPVSTSRQTPDASLGSSSDHRAPRRGTTTRTSAAPRR
jgi:AraC-like DNA-binding protein